MVTTAIDSRIQKIPLGDGVQAAYSLRDPSRPSSYSMRRPGNPHAEANLADYALMLGFPPGQLVMPHSWPHNGQVLIINETTAHVRDDRNGARNPIRGGGPAYHLADIMVTQSPFVILGVQGADCPPALLYDPKLKILGAAHYGWKVVARRGVFNTIAVFQALGSDPTDLKVWVGPGAGDDDYVFNPDDDAYRVLDEFGRRADFQAHSSTNRVDGTWQRVLALNAWVRSDLIQAGLQPANIKVDRRSCITNETLHSYRRAKKRGEEHGLSLATIRLTDWP